jgi:hypothetical protein
MRGTGQTTRQIQQAPTGAIFVAVGNGHYERDLAARLNRADLRIVTSDILDSLRDRFCGSWIPLVIDHACRLTEKQWEEVLLYRSLVRTREGR